MLSSCDRPGWKCSVISASPSAIKSGDFILSHCPRLQQVCYDIITIGQGFPQHLCGVLSNQRRGRGFARAKAAVSHGRTWWKKNKKQKNNCLGFKEFSVSSSVFYESEMKLRRKTSRGEREEEKRRKGNYTWTAQHSRCFIPSVWEWTEILHNPVVNYLFWHINTHLLSITEGEHLLVMAWK